MAIDWKKIYEGATQAGKKVVDTAKYIGNQVRDAYGGLVYGSTTTVPKGGESTTKINWPDKKVPMPPVTNKPTPTPVATPIPREIQKIIPPDKNPVQMPAPGQPTPTPMAVSDSMIDDIWGSQSENGKRILSKENAQRKVGRDVDIPNRINPSTGMWDDMAPILKKPDPFTQKPVESIDRGLFRINNITYLTWLRGEKERQMMYEAGIIDKPYKNWDGLDEMTRQKLWDNMLDPVLNTKFAKLLYDNWGADQWAVVRQGLVTMI
jgi:hypothetical protein